MDALPLRIECFDISNLMGTNTVASMVVFEAGAPKKSDYRRFTIRSTQEGTPDDFLAMEEVLTRRLQRWESEQDLSPNDPKRNESFATLPSLIVIDGGPGQLSAGVRALQGFIDKGVTVISLAKRIEEVFIPGRHEPLVLAHDTPELQLLQRVRDEAHRFAITHHRQRRDRQMTESVLDGLPGVGPEAQARAAEALRLARLGARRVARGARGGARAAVEDRPRRLRVPQPHLGLTRRRHPPESTP